MTQLDGCGQISKSRCSKRCGVCQNNANHPPQTHTHISFICSSNICWQPLWMLTSCRYKSFNPGPVWSNGNKKQRVVSRQQVGCQVTDTEVLRPETACNNSTWIRQGRTSVTSRNSHISLIILLWSLLPSMQTIHICWPLYEQWPCFFFSGNKCNKPCSWPDEVTVKLNSRKLISDLCVLCKP